MKRFAIYLVWGLVLVLALLIAGMMLITPTGPDERLTDEMTAAAIRSCGDSPELRNC